VADTPINTGAGGAWPGALLLPAPLAATRAACRDGQEKREALTLPLTPDEVEMGLIVDLTTMAVKKRRYLPADCDDERARVYAAAQLRRR